MLKGTTALVAGLWGFSAGPPFGLARAWADDPYAELRMRWFDRLTGGREFDESAPAVRAAVGRIDAAAEELWSTLRTDSSNFLWEDLDFQGTSHDQSIDIRLTYERLQELALAYATRSSRYEGDESLLTDLLYGLDWMHDEKYNAHTASYGGWWNWRIGVPLALNAICTMLYEELGGAESQESEEPQLLDILGPDTRPDTRLSRYMAAVDRHSPTPFGTGANRIWTCTTVAVRAALVEDPDKLATARDAISPVLTYTTSGDGFYEDGSFIQHKRHPYTGGYGVPLLANLERILHLLSDSPWSVTDSNVENVFHWVSDAYEPWLYRGSMISAVRGRNISRRAQQDHAFGHATVRAILWLADVAPPGKAAALRGLVKHTIEADTYRDFFDYSFGSSVPGNDLASIIAALEVSRDGAVDRREPTIRNKQFPRMDRVAHRRPGFVFALSMSSARIYNFEAINNENLRGWYTADGMHALYNQDLAHYDDHYWATVDHARLPGTTVPARQRADGSGRNYLSPKRWVGGAALDHLGAAGMAFQTYDDEVSGRKSWFMFKDRIAFLGAGITSASGDAVETIVENRKLDGLASNRFVVDGRDQSTVAGWRESFDDATWAHLEGSVDGADLGYVFPGGTRIHALRENRLGAWSDVNRNPSFTSDEPIERAYLTMWITHGVDPQGADYAWVLLPGASAKEVRSYSQAPDVEVLRNTPGVQAVRAGGALLANFWEPAESSVTGVTCEGRASVVIEQRGYRLAIAVSDPTQVGGVIRLRIKRNAARVRSLDPRIEVESMSPSITLHVDVAGARGDTAIARFDLRNPNAG